MTAAAPSPSRAVVLAEVRHGLVDPCGECRDLDTVLDDARAAERDGVASVVVTAPAVDAPRLQHRTTTAQALAVLLGTDHVRVVVQVQAPVWEPAALARFAAGATALSGDRLVIQVLGADGGRFAEALRARWPGEVVVGSTTLAEVA